LNEQFIVVARHKIQKHTSRRSGKIHDNSYGRIQRFAEHTCVNNWPRSAALGKSGCSTPSSPSTNLLLIVVSSNIIIANRKNRWRLAMIDNGVHYPSDDTPPSTLTLR
jgi:hypothetical protein